MYKAGDFVIIDDVDGFMDEFCDVGRYYAVKPLLIEKSKGGELMVKRHTAYATDAHKLYFSSIKKYVKPFISFKLRKIAGKLP